MLVFLSPGFLFFSCEIFYRVCYTQISHLTLKKSHAPKKWDMNGHLISIMLPDHNRMGIPVKKRDMNAIHPLKGEI